MKSNLTSAVIVFAIICISLSLHSCDGINTNTNFEIFKYQKTLDKQIRVYVANGEILPEGRWSSSINNYIRNHDSISKSVLKFQNDKLFYYVYELIGLKYSLHGDSIIVPLPGIGTSSTHIGYKRSDEADIHIFSINIKRGVALTYSANLNAVSIDEFIQSKESDISNLGTNDTMVVVKSIFQYKKN